MKRKYLLILLIFSIAVGYYIFNNTKQPKTAYELVNPFIGTGGHGHTFPGATLPFGMVQLSPDTRLTGWDGCSGYHYTDSLIYGFSHTHLSGTGISDYGDVLLMPFNSNQQISLNDIEEQKLIPSLFKKENESASPGIYRVHLDNPDTEVYLTVTKRAGIHKYKFNKKEHNKIFLDLNHRDKVLNSKINIESETSISGFRQSQAWANNQHVFFYIEFSKPFTTETIKNQKNPDNLYRILSFNNEVRELVIKVGISAVSIEGAKENLISEGESWDFNFYEKQAKNIWTNQLKKIEVTDKNEAKKSIFYSSLYHTMIAPNTFSDVNGNYRGIDQKIHQDTLNNTYTVFSLWDTFRATHPLYTLIEQKKSTEFINTFLKHYQQGGRLPVWELSSNETDCMIGYHSVSVIADAYVKGIRNYNINEAIEAMLHSANLNHFGLDSYKKYGYIRAGDEAESVSKTLEYAYDDWCIAQILKLNNNSNLYDEFIQRAQSYKNIFDPKTKFIRARLNGGWFKPFDPTEVNFNYTEANSWQYSMFVPQDISGLIKLYGGPTNFEDKLDNLFSASSETTGRHQADITGLIGQYAHGNEPSHHMAYLYNFIEKPWKTQERVHQIINEQYWNAPDGLSGNEDCGQMSAWFVLSTSSFYAVTPGTDHYVIGAPTFEEVTYNLENGNSFKIKSYNLSNQNKYIKSATLNGKEYQKSFLKHSEIIAGGELIFEMDDKPSETFGVGIGNFPKTSIDNHIIVPTPNINSDKKTFTDSLKIEIGSNCDSCEIQFTVKTKDYEKTKTYSEPFFISETGTVAAIAIHENGLKSKVSTAEYLKIKDGRRILVKTKYDNQYAAEGKNALIDHLKGSNNFRTGFWQGYQGQDIEAIVDLGKIETVNSIYTGFLQDNRSWIWYPENVEYFHSLDGKIFTKIKSIINRFPLEKEGSFTQEIGFKTNLKTRYIKMIAKNFGDCPEWHLGAGGKSWIFIDEISIE